MTPALVIKAEGRAERQLHNMSLGISSLCHAVCRSAVVNYGFAMALRSGSIVRNKFLPWVISDEGALPEKSALRQLSKWLSVRGFDDQDPARFHNVELAANVPLPEYGLPIPKVHCVQSIRQQIAMLLQFTLCNGHL